MELIGRYYDGRTSQSREVRVFVGHDGQFQVIGEQLNRQHPLSDVTISARIGNTPRTLTFPDGASCEIQDNDGLDRMLRGHRRSNAQGWIHHLESRLHWVVTAVVITLVCSWAMVTMGIPWMAEQAAYALPPSVDRSLGQGTLKVLDKAVFEPTQLEPEVRERLQARFESMVDPIPDHEGYRLEFRNSESMGANAVALPSGVIVVTDQLVWSSQHDDEVIAIMAHEIGHLVHRHSLRMAMQASALALLIATVTGDAFSSSTLASALPTMLIQAQYSQDFEHEADDYAYEYLVKNDISTQVFADVLTRIAGDDGEGDDALQYLSTHPATDERVERFLVTETPPP